MARFFALYTGKGDGCDYYIGCNMKFEELQSRSIESAKAEILQRVDDMGLDRVQSATIIEVADQFDADLRGIASERAALKQIAEKEKRREEFKKLQKEFGGK